MYVSGEQARYVQAEDGIRRMLVTIPLTEDVKRAAESDEEALDELLSNSAKVPVPANRQPFEHRIVPLTKKTEKESET